MKTLIVLLALSFALSSSASDIKLAWNASPTSGVTNYVIYAHTNTLNNTNYMSAVVRLAAGTNLTASIDSIQPGQWWFAATAMKGGLESDLSNVLQVEVPQSPAGMRTVVVQFSVGLTNFYDVGYFRLRLP